jgi:hypothetical protein
MHLIIWFLDWNDLKRRNSSSRFKPHTECKTASHDAASGNELAIRAGAAGSGAFGSLPPPAGPPPPPATYYRVRLVGQAWGEDAAGRTWVHREPRDRTLGDMLRRLQKSLTAGLPKGTPVVPLPSGATDGDGDPVVGPHR